ncbi:MAG TPA: hypothetical protein PLL71_17165, partial [Agriterribacter sp.]|nr:hypothetical protein [Agriterribacter sp.]
QLGVGKKAGHAFAYELDLNADGIKEYRLENDSVQVTLLATGARVIEYIVKSRKDNVLFKLWPEKPEDDKRPFRKYGFYPYGGFEDFLGQASMETHQVYDAQLVKKEGDYVQVIMTADYFGNRLQKTFTLYGNSPLLEVRFALNFINPEANVIGPQPILELGKAHGTEDVFIAPDKDSMLYIRMRPEEYFGRVINLKEGWNAGYDTREDISFVGAYPVTQPLFLHMWMNHPSNGESHYYYTEFQPWVPIIQKTTMYFTYYLWGAGGGWEESVQALRKRNLITERSSFKSMKRLLLKSILFVSFLPGICIKANAQALKLTKLELNYPSPAIPYYHIKADINLPSASMIEVEMTVNGKTLRYTDLRPEHDLGDLSYPHLTNRPPSGSGLSQDNILYLNPSVIGWVKWNPGEQYDVKITVRMKKNVQHAKNDVVLTANKKITAPAAAAVYDTAWKKYKSVVLSETAGIDREAEPVEVLLPFYPDEVHDLKREIRVAAFNPQTHNVTEVPSQVYDIQEYLVEDDLAPDENGKPTREVPVWMPTVTARVAFLADVPARSSRVFFVYYDNRDAMVKTYTTDLRVQGEAPGLQIDNDYLSVALHPKSGHFDQLTLKSKPQFPLYHRKETNGAIHWNPEIYTPPVPWTHTSDWDPPEHVQSLTGPVIAFSDVWGSLREIPQVDASVRYEFFPGKPYFISTTNLRI